MPDLQPYEDRLRMQGQINQLTSPPPQPQVPNVPYDTTNDTLVNGVRGRLGDILAANLIERQKQRNQAMITDTLTKLTAIRDDVKDQVFSRTGYNVEEHTDANGNPVNDVDRYVNDRFQEAYRTAMDGLDNDFQREAVTRQWLPAMLADMNTVHKYRENERKTEIERTYGALLNKYSDNGQAMMFEGDLDSAQAEYESGIEQIKYYAAMNGYAPPVVQKMIDDFMNGSAGQGILDLFNNGEYDKAYDAYQRFGTRLTGTAKNKVEQAITQGTVIVEGRRVGTEAAQRLLSGDNINKYRNADGSFNWEAFDNDLAWDLENNPQNMASYNHVDATGAATSSFFGAYNAGGDFAEYTAVIMGGEYTDFSNPAVWTTESPAGAYGAFQITPYLWNVGCEKAGFDPNTVDKDNPRVQIAVKDALIREAISEGVTNWKEMAVWWHNGNSPDSPWALRYYKENPNDPRWDEPTADGVTTNGYIELCGKSRDKFLEAVQNDSGKPTAPTYEIPVADSDIEDFNLEGTDLGLKSTLPYLGGILMNILGSDRMSQVVITSGKRSPENNASVGGAQQSRHLTGNAVDIALPDDLTDEEAQQVLKAVQDTGLYRYVDYHDYGTGWHLHVDEYQSNLRAWQEKNGYATTSSGVRITSVSVNNSPQFNGVATAAAHEYINGILAREQQQLNNVINQGIAQNFSSREAVAAWLDGVLPNLPALQRRSLIEEIYSKNAQNMYKADMADSERDRQQKEAINSRNATEKFYAYVRQNGMPNTVQAFRNVIQQLGVGDYFSQQQLFNMETAIGRGEGTKFQQFDQMIEQFSADVLRDNGFEPTAYNKTLIHDQTLQYLSQEISAGRYPTAQRLQSVMQMVAPNINRASNFGYTWNAGQGIGGWITGGYFTDDATGYPIYGEETTTGNYNWFTR